MLTRSRSGIQVSRAGGERVKSSRRARPCVGLQQPIGRHPSPPSTTASRDGDLEITTGLITDFSRLDE